MRPGIFTRKKLREIIPGLTKTQENQVIELYLMSREKPAEDKEDEDESPVRCNVQVKCQSKNEILIDIKGL